MVAAPIDLNAPAPAPALPTRSASPAPEKPRVRPAMDDRGKVFQGELERAWNRESETPPAPDAAEQASPPSSSMRPVDAAPDAGAGSPVEEGDGSSETPAPAALQAEALLRELGSASIPPAPSATEAPAAQTAGQADFLAPPRPAVGEPPGAPPAAGEAAVEKASPAESLVFERPSPGEAAMPPTGKPEAAEKPAAATAQGPETAEPKRQATPRNLPGPPEGAPSAPRDAPAPVEAERGSAGPAASRSEEAGGPQIPAPESFPARAADGRPAAASSAALPHAASPAPEAAVQEQGQAPRLQPQRPDPPGDSADAEAAAPEREAPGRRAPQQAHAPEAALPESPAHLEKPSAAAGNGPREPRAETVSGHRAQAPPAAGEREVPGMPGRAQLFDPIVQRATLLARGGREEIRIDLKPDFLGPVRMQIATAHQAVSVRILAEMPLARDWIEAGLQQLKLDLEQQGLRVERLEVAIAPDDRQGSERREGFRERAASSPPAAPRKGLEIAQAAGAGRGWQAGPWEPAAGRGLLDLFA